MNITLKKLLNLICLLAIQPAIFAQTFEYIQNKGQWDNEVLYKGELSNGAFYLKQNGYRVLQHNPDDLDRLKGTITGHPHYYEKGNLRNPSASAATVINNGTAGGSAAAAADELVLRSHAYDMVFVGANPKAPLVGTKQMPGYFNYIIGNDPKKWQGEVHSFGEVWMQQLYPGVDVRYYSENGFIKFDLVAQPNAPLEKIAMQYVGVDKLSLRNGELIVKTSVSEVREQAPYSYQLVDGVRKQVDCRYELIGNVVRFKMTGYDPSKPVIIDPTLIFASFTGSVADNWGYAATYDGSGNLYAAGIAFANGYPVTPGAFQTTFRGGCQTGEGKSFDMAIMKFNPNGTQRVYATYIGGSTCNEFPHSLVVDGANNLVIAGRTTSSDYPTTSPLIGPGGNWDIIVTKLNAAGTGLVGSVRMGGGSDDGVNIRNKYPIQGAQELQQNYGDDSRSEVILDRSGNILVASSTQSSNFPVTAGVVQNALSGPQDAALIKFNPNLTALQFSTYLGGSGYDAGYVLTISPAGNIYVGGGTTSNNFPGNKSGTVGQNYAGGQADGYVAEIDPNGTGIIKSCYIGTNGLDQVYGIQFDRNGFVYVLATSTGNFPVINAPFSQAGGKQFIGKLQNDLSAYVYSTVFGTSANRPNISPTAFLVDRCENVYVSGWGGNVTSAIPQPFPNSGTAGLTVTSDAILRTTDGTDFYFFVLEKDAASQLYGSFYGQQAVPGQPTVGDHVDGGTSRFDADGVIYQAVCANCSGGQFPITPGVVGPSNPSGQCNQAVIKIAMDLSGVRGGVKSSIRNVDGDTSDCVPATVNFRDTVAIARSYEWDFGDGTRLVTTTPDVTHVFNSVGTFRVMLVSVDNTKCYTRDTSYVNIRVRTDRATLAASNTKLPPCQSNLYRFDNLSTPPAGKPFTNTSFFWIFGDGTPPQVAGTAPVTHQFASAGTYNVQLVLVDTSYCNAPDTITQSLRVSPLVQANFQTPQSGCAPYNAAFTNTSLGGQQFFWDFGDGTTSTLTSPVKLYAVPGTFTVKLVAIDSSTCNIIDSTTQTITVSGSPRADFSFSPNPPEENIITTYTNLSEVVPEYRWFFGDGDSLITFRKDTIVRHQFRQTGTYNSCLVAINQFGCRDTICRPVSIIINPLLDVVSAFTPNGDGINDRAVVIGYGVAKLTFRIYNRWGQLMFESADERVGWDGKFNGKLQPMDAYGYTLDAEMVSGERIRKSGSITLIR